MGDRRMGDRREKEQGVIRIKFKDAVTYVVLGVILLISLIVNIVLGIKLHEYRKISGLYLDMQNGILGEESVDVDELMNGINADKE